MDPSVNKRLLSLDAYRGITMFLLVAEAALLYHAFFEYFPEDSVGHQFMQQFHHHPWDGLRFWDLIQPFFMFIAGVAMPFSLRKRLSAGDSWEKAFLHILFRCFLLFLFGVGLHCVYNQAIVWELWNVLTQLSFTILVTFLLMRFPIKYQLYVSLGLLVLTEVLYRSYDPSMPFIKDQNFGSWMDMILMGKINPGGGWVAINCLPTAAHTIWGAIAGQLLLEETDEKQKLEYLIVPGLIGLIVGYGLHYVDITPIIKRIATTSFVIVSGGWCLLALAFLYWVVDLRGVRNWTKFFIILGMNSIFAYLFAETIGKQWLIGFVEIFNHGFLKWIGFSDTFLAISQSVLVLGGIWYLCYFLYQRKIFFKI